VITPQENETIKSLCKECLDEFPILKKETFTLLNFNTEKENEQYNANRHADLESLIEFFTKIHADGWDSLNDKEKCRTGVLTEKISGVVRNCAYAKMIARETPSFVFMELNEKLGNIFQIIYQEVEDLLQEQKERNMHI
jgi:hypothetical protein